MKMGEKNSLEKLRFFKLVGTFVRYLFKKMINFVRVFPHKYTNVVLFKMKQWCSQV